MELLPNVIIDKLMADKIKYDTLSELDKLKIELANFAADLFPAEKVYINANQQSTTPPCLFVDFYSVTKQKRLYNTAEYEIGFTISYIALNPLSSTELDNALFLLQQDITDIESYKISSISGDITDGIANITGLVKINEINTSDYELINKAEQELNLT